MKLLDITSFQALRQIIIYSTFITNINSREVIHTFGIAYIFSKFAYIYAKLKVKPVSIIV